MGEQTHKLYSFAMEFGLVLWSRQNLGGGQSELGLGSLSWEQSELGPGGLNLSWAI